MAKAMASAGLGECLLERTRHLMNKNNTGELLVLFNYLKNKLISSDLMKTEKEIISLIGKQVFRDASVEHHFPKVARDKNFIALSSISNGNCLYSTISISLFGTNKYCSDLRVMACAELFLNAEFYAKHPLLLSVFERNKDKFSKFNSVFSCCLSEPVFEKFDKKAIDLVSVCKQEAFLNCSNHTWSSFLMVLSLSFATERCIATFYPDKPENKYCLIFNDKKIFPHNLSLIHI